MDFSGGMPISVLMGSHARAKRVRPDAVIGVGAGPWKQGER